MKIISWNIDGLKSKCYDEDFISYFKNFDIVCFIETWIESESEIPVFGSGFKSYFCPAIRNSTRGRAMAGIIIYYRNEYQRYISRIYEECDFAIFLKVDKTSVRLLEDLIICFAYIPPINSPFYEGKDNSGVDLLESTLREYDIQTSESFLLMGDLNARTGDRMDYFTFDRNIPELQTVEDLLDDSHMSPRVSNDKHVNNFGVKLIDFCKVNTLRIANGRLFKDQNVGDFTFVNHNGCSVIDYLLYTDNIVKSINDFGIETRSESSHLPIRVHLKCYTCNSDHHTTATSNIKQKYVFNQKNCNAFEEKLSYVFTDELYNEIDSLLESQLTDIDTLVSTVTDLIKECSQTCLKTFKSTQQKSSNWFNNTCKTLKYKTQRALRMFRRDRTNVNLSAYLIAKNEYREYCKTEKDNFNSNVLINLENSCSDGQTFWQKFKRLVNKQSRRENISIDQWKDHFEGLFQSLTLEDSELPYPDDVYTGELTDALFNDSITDDEIIAVIKDMKKGKSGGSDELVPECFIYSLNYLLPVLRKLFNRIFSTGTYPSQWRETIIIPLYKKGDPDVTDNYRGISLLNVMGKIYTGIINRRLTFFINIFNRLSENQSGFREGYRTVDNAFILHSLVNKQLSTLGKKLYVAYVDFQKAFDVVNRVKLFNVMSTNGIHGKLYSSFRAMYLSVKGRVRANHGTLSESFNCPLGLRQGCIASPVLFILFINEFIKLIEPPAFNGIQLFPDTTQINSVFFADDLALLADTPCGLQRLLNALSEFCYQFGLNVNIKKTKIMVFKNGGTLSKFEKWNYRGTLLDVVNDFTYVGVLLTRQLSLNRMASDQALKSKRVLLTVLSRLYDYGQMNKSTFFKIFDTKVVPILLYGAEIWGAERMVPTEQVQLYACKRYMCIPKHTMNFPVLGDCGRFPMFIIAIKRVLKYWMRIIKLPNYRFVRKAYDLLYLQDQIGNRNWVTNVRNILCQNGYNYVWLEQNVNNEKLFISRIIQTLKDQYLQEWRSAVIDSPKLTYYSLFKDNLCHENYLDIVKIRKFRNAMACFRCSSHDLEIERGRYISTPRDRRICKLCNIEPETEYHFMFKCQHYNDLRLKYLPSKYYTDPTVNKFTVLMSSRNEQIVLNVSMFIFYAMKYRKLYLTDNN